MQEFDKLSPQVLGQIALMEGVVMQLPTVESILAFTCQGFLCIPGVKHVNHSLKPNPEFNAVHRLPILYKSHLFAEILFDTDQDGLNGYLPFLSNYCNMLGVLLEERRQREINRHLLLEMEDRVSERTKALQDLLNAASHDLRRPMVSVNGFSQELEDLLSNPKDLNSDSFLHAQEFLSRIRESIVQMNEMLTGLLTISRLQRDVPLIKSTPIHDLIVEIWSNLNVKEDARLEIPDQMPPCQADPDLLRRALTEILKNSLENAKPTHPLIVRCTAEIQDNSCMYLISDNGIGIADSTLTNIFDIFFQAVPHHKKGIGTGLTIAKQIILKNKGTIGASHSQGGGLTIWFRLPM